MNFAQKYFNRFVNYPVNFEQISNENLEISVVIPCYNEPELNRTLKSLNLCKSPTCNVEIIIIINSSQTTDVDIISFNRGIYKSAKKLTASFKNKKVQYLIRNIENLPAKFAGVGLARKIGMDEALLRFGKNKNPKGIIVGLDADSVVEENYFTEIEHFFKNNPDKNACSIHFEHPTEGVDFEENIYKSIISYELHLRYYVNALIYAEFPYAFHTIGSSFAVRAETYAKQGGMNRRKAGEDFYFLQKIIPLAAYGEITKTKVIPSPRISDRVVFGTGAAVAKMISNEQDTFFTYNLRAFSDLKILFQNINIFIQPDINDKNINKIKLKLPENIFEFLYENKFFIELKKIQSNSPNDKIFRKRFFDWFNAFRVLKFMNFVHQDKYLKISVKEAVGNLFRETGKFVKPDISEKELLKILILEDKNRSRQETLKK